ncbi:MAG: tRNA pseudouridine(55) synthase TruB [Pirellulales bacterium]|nr:tRNA pseudouridine(55) synthase TruB [Pirellulales bacterium]
MPRFGLLNINKPPGLTSRDVVNRVERLIRPDKAGHAGTLDPLATGVLIVCVGQATRLIEYVQRMPKRYRATFLLGRSSPSDDVETQVSPLDDAPRPSREQIAAALPRFVGPIMQRPPAYSAVHVAGQRAYALARQGKSVDLPPREVAIHELRIERYECPELVLEIECGSGTYVRSLGRDLAESLGTAAVMSALVRTAIGDFHVDAASELDSLTADNLPAVLAPARQAVAMLSTIKLAADEVGRIVRGQTIRRPVASADSQWAALAPGGELLAILRRREDGSLGPARVFPSALELTPQPPPHAI